MSDFVENSRDVKVSVCIVTHNQKKYIQECLNGLLNQDCDFNYEIIVGDDASTDGTSDVVAEYAKRYPGLITHVLHRENIGPTRNYMAVHGLARGVYLCHMDGDDIALQGKLRKQAEFLDCNEDCVLVWHQVNVFDDEGRVTKILHSRLAEVVDVNRIARNDLLRFGMLGAHSSTMYRRSAIPDFQHIRGEVLDYFMICQILRAGRAARLEEILGGYRVNERAKTASKNRSLYFRGSLIRDLYCSHLNYFYEHDVNGVIRADIFLNAFFNFLVDVRFMRPSSFRFFLLAVRSVTPAVILELPDYFARARRLRKS